MKKSIFAILFLLIPILCYGEDKVIISEDLMRSTFKIADIDDKVCGTVFIIGVPVKNSKYFANVLVTANHVLEDIEGDTAIIVCRKKKGDTYERYPMLISIRKEGKPLWVRHPVADVAAIYVSIPKEIDFDGITIKALASDDMLKDTLFPGTQIACLGYPYGLEGEAGFPILRSGAVASYPVVPSNYDGFLFDFEIFGGNSGGPVFCASTDIKDLNNINYIHALIGLVTSKIDIINKQTKKIIEPLKIAYVVRACYIRETISLLPPLQPPN